MILLLAIALGLIGSYLLYISWKQNNKFAALAGWVSLFVTVPLLVMDLGPEFGTVFAPVSYTHLTLPTSDLV